MVAVSPILPHSFSFMSRSRRGFEAPPSTFLPGPLLGSQHRRESKTFCLSLLCRNCTALFPECRCWDSSLRFSFSPTFSFSVFGSTRLLAISPGSGQDLQQSSDVTFADTIASGITIHVGASPMGELWSPHGLSLVPNTCLPPSTGSLRKSALGSQDSAQKSNGCLLSGGSESSFLDHCTEGTCE